MSLTFVLKSSCLTLTGLAQKLCKNIYIALHFSDILNFFMLPTFTLTEALGKGIIFMHIQINVFKHLKWCVNQLLIENTPQVKV